MSDDSDSIESTIRRYEDAKRTPRPEDDRIGLSEAELLSRMGEPTDRTPGRWIYARPLVRGAHYYRDADELVFEDGRVARVNALQIWVGCILVE